MNGQQPIQQSQLPPFTLYVLSYCGHCADAFNFLKVRNVPGQFLIADGDPIILSGLEKLGKPPEFPILVSRIPVKDAPKGEIIQGFKKEEYARILDAYYDAVVASAANVPGGQQQPVPAAQVATSSS